jgi:hypothetical protein
MTFLAIFRNFSARFWGTFGGVALVRRGGKLRRCWCWYYFKDTCHLHFLILEFFPPSRD